MRVMHIDTRNIQPGDTFITPGTNLPYRVDYIGDFTHNMVRGWERKARCTWLDTHIPFDNYFHKRGVKTLREES